MVEGNYSAPLWAWVIVLLLYYSKNCIEFRISVLHSSFSDGVQLGKIIGTAVCSEATTDFLFYLDFPNSPLTGIVIVWHTWIGEKGEQVVFDLKDTSLEFLKLVI